MRKLTQETYDRRSASGAYHMAVVLRIVLVPNHFSVWREYDLNAKFVIVIPGMHKTTNMDGLNYIYI